MVGIAINLFPSKEEPILSRNILSLIIFLAQYLKRYCQTAPTVDLMRLHTLKVPKLFFLTQRYDEHPRPIHLGFPPPPTLRFSTACKTPSKKRNNVQYLKHSKKTDNISTHPSLQVLRQPLVCKFTLNQILMYLGVPPQDVFSGNEEKVSSKYLIRAYLPCASMFYCVLLCQLMPTVPLMPTRRQQNDNDLLD